MATLHEILADMQGRGFQVDHLEVETPEFVRVPIAGDKNGQKSGSYRIKEINGKLFAYYRNFKTGQDFRSGQDGTSSLSQEELGVMALLKEQERQEQEKRYQEAAAKVRESLPNLPDCQDDNPYLKRKGVPSVPGLKVDGEGIVVPVYGPDKNGEPDYSRNPENIMSAQVISPDGGKKNVYGGKMQGGHFVIAGKSLTSWQHEDNIVCVGEGLATAITVWLATGYTVICAFSGGNLIHVAKMIKGATVLICGDNDTSKEGNPGLKYAKEAAKATGARLAVPVMPEGAQGTDFNDLAAAAGLEAVKKIIEEALKGAGNQALSTEDFLKGFAVSTEYVNKLGQEISIYPNLIIKQHVVTIIAMSGGGKTTFLFYIVSPELSKQGLKVWYIDADSPASDHKRMKEFADNHGFEFLNPDVNQGTSAKGLIDGLKQIANAHQDQTGNVFVFDTLKKFADLMRKESVKDFYRLCRKLANLGATVVLLGHANKYRDKDGNLVFEGVGDIRSDSDELIQLEAVKNQSGGTDVTTVIDPDRGAKVRGIFQPFSFNISRERVVTFYDLPLPLTNVSMTATPKAIDGEILDAIENYLREVREPVKQTPLVRHIADKMTGASIGRVRKLLVQNSGPKGQGGARFLYTAGKDNSHFYELQPKQQTVFPE